MGFFFVEGTNEYVNKRSWIRCVVNKNLRPCAKRIRVIHKNFVLLNFKKQCFA